MSRGFPPRPQAGEGPREVGRQHEGRLDEGLTGPAGGELCPGRPAQHSARAHAQRRVELGQAPDRRALKDGELLDFARDRGDDLDPGGARPDHRDPLAAQVDRVIPARAVHGLSGELVDAGDVGRFGLTEHSRGADHVARREALAARRAQLPGVCLLVERRTRHFRIQADAIAHAVLVDAVLGIGLELAARRVHA